MRSVGFVGGGRVTRILLGGWHGAGVVPDPLFVCEPDDGAFRALDPHAPSRRRASLEEAAATDLVFLALHPPVIPAVLPVLRMVLSPRAVLVSLAPKVTLAALASGTGTARVVRMIPNAPSLVGQGFNPVVFGPGVDAETRAEITARFAAWGEVPEVDEAQLEAYAILTGMGPTYFWFQWQTLRQIAQELGLSDTATDAALRSMLTGAVATMLDSGLSPADVIDLVPVKPLAAAEAAITAAYREALPALHARIAPAPSSPR